jgi:uncharacterized protein YndB with AHSA1/START domain
MSRVLALLALLALGMPAAHAEVAERTIHKEVLIDATLDQAWAAWTTREGIISFLAPDAQIEPRVGGAFQIHFDPLAEPGLKGADDMRYMALQPMRMLSFDWSAPPSLPEARKQRTFVVLRFEPVGGRQTRLILTHVGWGDGGEWDKAFTYFDRAWGTVFADLQKRFQTGPIDWTDWLNQLRKMHAQPDAKK